ncbi:hypothetical protein DPEC_G00337510 [Dallia pectoralis]|uniref:Uncharacterized protein n=1 Tax=Dallia pectoralis TaxID=75939 RepID=A0ACC2F7E1_DALPE|nr:hypothetical protein DPEC_G00337510 [Dallia pectoralis]
MDALPCIENPEWSSMERQLLSSPLEEVVEWGEMEELVNKADQEEQGNSPPPGKTSKVPEENWDSMTAPVYSMTCPSVPLNFATVQWDIPDSSTDTPSPITDNSSADELDIGAGASLDWTLSPLSHQQILSCVTLVGQNTPEKRVPLKTDQRESLNQSRETPNPEVTELGPHIENEKPSAPFEDHDDSLSGNPCWPDPGNGTEEIIRTSDRNPSPVQREESENGLDADSLGTGLEEKWELTCTTQTMNINCEHVCSYRECEEMEIEEKREAIQKEKEEEQTVTGFDWKLLTDQSDIIGQLAHPFESAELKQLSEKSAYNGQSDYTEEYNNSPETSEQPDVSDKHVEFHQVENQSVLQQAEQSDNIEQSEQSESTEQPARAECLKQMHLEQKECVMQMKQSEQSQQSEQDTEQMKQSEQSQQSEQDTEQMKQSEQSQQSEQDTEQLDQSEQSEQVTEQMKQSEQTGGKSGHSKQLEELLFLCTEELKLSEQHREEPKPSETNQLTQTVRTELTKQDGHTQDAKQVENSEQKDDLLLSHREGIPEQNLEISDPACVQINDQRLDREKACRLAERLYRLDGIHQTDVVKHLDKDNDFSQAVGEEYLKFFDFTGQSLDQGLRSFLRVVVLIGETQERERVLQHFSCRFQQCNPDTFSSSGDVLTLTCAVMLLNCDLHGQNVGKSMSASSFVSNLDGMKESENFNKELLKALYNSIKNEPLQWAVNDKELKSSMLLPADAKDDAPLRSKSNPFQDVPHDKKATVFKQGFLQRKAHADIDGKRTPWGKRSWKTFYAVLRGMVLYLQKDEYKIEWQSTEEVVSVHHALTEQAAEYTKRPHVFRLQTADWRVFLFQASSTAEMSSWISRINLVSALHSSPPFPAAVGSQKRFCRPILPASRSEHTLEKQLQSHVSMHESFQEDLVYLQQSLHEGRKTRSKELEEHRAREEYLQHEKCRYEAYIQMLKAWKDLNQSADIVVRTSKLNMFDDAVCLSPVDQEAETGTLKKSHSSPSLVLEIVPPPMVKVKRNVSERRTYRKIVIPRRNQDI